MANYCIGPTPITHRQNSVVTDGKSIAEAYAKRRPPDSCNSLPTPSNAQAVYCQHLLQPFFPTWAALGLIGSFVDRGMPYP